MKKRLSLALATYLLVLGICAGIPLSAGASDASGTQYTIVVVPKALENNIFLDVKSAAQTEGAKLGVRVEWTGPLTSDAEKQVEAMQRLIERGVDGILISCNDAVLLTDVINRAMDAQIAVATFDSDAPESRRLFHIGSDNYALGQASAQQLRALLPDGGKVAVLVGMPDAKNLQERLEGFYDGLEGSGITCYPAVSGQDELWASVAVVESFTAETDDLDAWFFVGGWPLFAAPEDLPNLSEFSKNGGHVVAVDAAYPMLRFVEEGIVDVLLGQGYAEMGEVGIQRLVAILNGDDDLASEDVIVYSAMEVVTADNLEEARASKTPW